MLVVMFFLVIFIFLWYMWLVGFYLCVDKIFFFIVCSYFFFFVIILCVIFEDLLKIVECEVLDIGNYIKYVKFV